MTHPGTNPSNAERAWSLRAYARPMRKWLAYAPLAAGVLSLAGRSIATIFRKVGHPAAALDDSYIHFQYARAIAEGHPFRFEAGEPFTSGSTSTLWPALLAPFWLLGARDERILWAAWGLSFLALGGLAWEAAKLTERLAGRTAAVGAGAMVLAFSGFAWCAASGMEVVPFAWVIARACRRAAEFSEATPSERTPRRAGELVALAWGAALFRPEGAVFALFVALTLAVFPRPTRWDARLSAAAAGAALLATPLLLLLLTGTAQSNTAVAKLLPGNPYYVGPALKAAVEANVRLLVGTILNGEVWSTEFLPHGGAPLATAGLGAMALLGARTRLRWRTVGALLLAVAMFAPCFYYTFLWNRLRYLWPFATGWIIGLACLARLVGDALGAVRARWRVATPILCGVFVGMFATKLEWTIDDVAQSASGIDRQQVALAHWAKESLPPSARIGVNDTGAIAYFGDRKTFDVVGLTTEGEARYWVAGAASRLEHYERLHATEPAKLPTHFIVYPQWMALPMVLGTPLHEATVTDSTILGGQTMRAYEADWSQLGSGEKPWTPTRGPLVDALDVADLESEADHGYQLLGAREGEEVAHEGEAPDGTSVIDGGRGQRSVERFTARLRPGVGSRCVVRLDAPADTVAKVLVNGAPVTEFNAGDAETWEERSFDIPADVAGEHSAIELQFSNAVTTYHYWFVAPG